MSDTIKRKRGDNRAFAATLKRAGRTVKLVEGESENGQPFATRVKFCMKPVAGSDGQSIEGVADILEAGRVSYTPSFDEVGVAGIYRAEFEVTWSDTTVETYPNGDYVHVEILPDLNPPGASPSRSPSGSVSPSASASPSPSP